MTLPYLRALRCLQLTMLLVAAASAGCGTTRRSDTGRTAIEQLLISDAVDLAVAQMDFSALAGKKVYFDPQFLGGTVDEKYLVSTIRQHLLHHGCILSEVRSDATYVVEARAGAVGTNRHDVMIGIPAINLPSAVSFAGVPSSIPEVPVAKSTDQRGVAKIALFAYNRETGRSVWQSGANPVASRSKDMWILGAGPFQQGTIYDGTRFAGSRIFVPLGQEKQEPPNTKLLARVTGEAFFAEPSAQVASNDQAPSAANSEAYNAAEGVIPASADKPAQSPLPDAEVRVLEAQPAPPTEDGDSAISPRLLQAAPPDVRPIEPADDPSSRFDLFRNRP